MISYGVQQKNINGLELANAIRGLGYINAFKYYKIPSKEVKQYLTSQGIAHNEKITTILCSYDQCNSNGMMNQLMTSQSLS